MGLDALETCRIQALGTCFGQSIVLDLQYIVTVGVPGGNTNTQVNEILNQMFGAVGVGNDVFDAYLACLPPQYALSELRFQSLKPVRKAYFSLLTPGSVGKHASAATVACDSASVFRRTLLAGRRQVSTLKVGPVPDAVSVAGLLAPAYQAILGTFGSSTLKTLVMPVSTIQLVPTILTAAGFWDNRDLVSFGVGAQSRVMHRRVVGIGS